MAHLLVDGVSYNLEGKVTTIGRNPSCTIMLKDQKCSKIHCRLEQKEGQYIVTDNNSRNGIRVNDKLVDTSPLSHNDTITIGTSVMVFTTASEDPSRDHVGASEQSPDETHTKEDGSSTRTKRLKKHQTREEVDPQKKLLQTIILYGSGILILALLGMIASSLLSRRETVPQQTIQKTEPKKERTIKTEQSPSDAAFAELQKFQDTHREDVDAILEKMKDFETKYPQSKHLATLSDLIQQSYEAQDQQDLQDMNDVMKDVTNHLLTHQYAKALKALEQYIAHHRPSSHRTRAFKERGKTISLGTKYFTEERVKILNLKKEKKYPEAQKAYIALRSQFGDGNVSGFKDICDAIQDELQIVIILEKRSE